MKPAAKGFHAGQAEHRGAHNHTYNKGTQADGTAGCSDSDCAPGASCTAVQSIEGCDYCILVTEPTPFGLHDLKIALELVRKMRIPFGVVVNKSMEHDTSIQDYCRNENIEVLMEIPYLREIAENYSRGVLPAQINDEWKERFVKLYARIKGGAAS